MKQISVQKALEQLKSDKTDWPFSDFDGNIKKQFCFCTGAL